MSTALETLKSRLADVNALHSAVALMDWDQQTYMPHGGADARAVHTSVLSRMAHETFVADETQKALGDATPEGPDDEALLRVVKRDLELATKLPSKLVEEKTRLASIAHEEWVKARAENDYASFSPTLARMFEIAKEEADHLGYTDDPYDALLNQYEEGGTAKDVRAMFDAIRGPQVELVKAIGGQPKINDSVLYGDWEEAKQREFTLMLVKEVGFDLERGRQDTAPHPFCTGWSIGDTRLTTRFKPYIGSAIFGSLHEAGHGVYEQGSPQKWDLTPLAGGVSLGIHESQSRLWENIVGRSLPFWKRFFPQLAEKFPALAGLGAEGYYRLINKVEPSLIRVEADEVTYNLHVMVRFEIESAMLKGELDVKSLPDAWNAKYEEYLGITPPSDAEGCLQDVHWSQGSIGYFPTYTMGNLLSYQFWTKLQEDLGDTDALIENGEFAKILGWLGEQIYSKGRSMPPKDLVQHVTGRPMDPKPYLDGLGAKYRALYGL
ncbi:carboxypeptidase M32 [bacterium]|nr:MAG: carboxypeptidase M32 [bacterium]